MGGGSRLFAGALLAAAGLLGPTLVAPPAAADPVTHQAHDQLDPLGAEQAWQYSTGTGVTVAVLDSGVDADHPALAGRVLPGRDYVDDSTDGRVDPVGHGTTVASLVAGAGDPAIGLAPEATILPVRVLDDQNRYQDAATVAQGVMWAVDQGAQVINLSLGGARDSASLGAALAYAMAHDVVVVACTGNTTGSYREIWYPAREPGVVAVAGITFAGGTPRHWPASLTGPETVLAAPAVMTGAAVGGGYREVQGTSFASALVAGTAALIRARWPELSAGDVVNRLVSTAEEAGAPGRDPIYGFGAIDPVAALTEPVPEVPANPLDTTPSQGAAGFGAAPDREQALPAPATSGAADRSEPAGQPAGGAADETAGGGGYDRPSGPAWLLLAALTAALVAAATVRARRYR
jgi:type VII secretion-associated serine protease mycosin